MARLEDLDLGDDRIDDRWTETKLMSAGYTHRGDRACQTCGDLIALYHKDTLKGARWLILNEGVLTPHRCS